MEEKIETARQLLYDLYHLPVSPLDCEKQILSFGQRWMMHTLQNIMGPDMLSSTLKTLRDDTILHVTDRFQVHFILLRLKGTPFAIGPFCSLLLTARDVQFLFGQYQISDLTVKDFLAYRSQFPVMNAREALNIAASLVKVANPADVSRKVEYLDEYKKAISLGQPYSEADGMRQNYYRLIQERYQIERRFMEDITKGNSHAAILNLRNMQRDVAFLKRIGTTLENERIGAAIMRTMVRIAASEAGLPADTVDLLSSQNTKAVMSARTVEDIYQEKEKMVRAFCREIHSHKNRQYSNLVLSTLYYIEHQFTQPVTVGQIAEELNVSPNYLTACFRKETGLTPVSFLRKTRMKHAATLLANTDLTVQNVSSLVGIADANYFIKQFKKEYEETPSQYRKYHRL